MIPQAGCGGLSSSGPDQRTKDEGISQVPDAESGSAEVRPGPDGVDEAREPGKERLDLEEAWADVERQRELAQKREELRRRKEAEQVEAWKEFMRNERRELELRQDGQLLRLLGEPLPGEPATALRQLADHDQTQAKRGLVALTSGGNTVYKPLDELQPEDMPARIAANRLRTTWLKERRDTWLGRGEIAP